MPDGGSTPHEDENKLTPKGDQANSGTAPHNPGEDREKDLNQKYAGSHAADSLRSAEEQGAGQQAGKPGKSDGKQTGSDTGQDGPAKRAANAKADVKAGEEKAEGAGFFNADKDKAKEEKPKQKGRLSKRQRIGGGIALFSIIGGSGLGIFAAIQGPLEFINISQELAGAHLDPLSDQGDSSMFKVMRYLHYWNQGRPERTRMGIVGNKMADKIEARFNAAGIESKYTPIGGFQKGVLIDPQKLSSGDFKHLNGKNSAEVVKFFQEKYKVPVTPAGVGSDGHTRFLIDTDKMGFLRFNALTRDLMRSAGYHYLAPGISGRKMAVRGGIDMHWLKRKLNEKGKTYEERITAIREQDEKSVKRGTEAPTITATDQKDKEGNPINDKGGTDATNEIGEEAKEALAKDAAGDKTALDTFKQSMKVKYGLLGVGVVGLICAAYAISSTIDELNQKNVEDPLKRVGMGMGVSVGDQVADGGDDVNSEHLGVISKLNYNRDAKPGIPAGDWAQNNATLANRGMPQSAEQAPANFNINPQGNPVTQFLGAFPGLDGICQVVNSVGGVIVLTALSYTPGIGIAKNILQIGAGLIAMDIIVGWIIDYFTANVVDPAVAGPVHGYALEYGTQFAASDIGLTRAAGPVSNALAMKVRSNSTAASMQEFQSKSLASRLFDTKDNRSFIAQVVDKQAPDPATNVAIASRGMLNIGQSFGSLFSGIFSKTVKAADNFPGYDYGVPSIMWDPNQLDDPAFDNPGEVGDNAANIMDGNNAASPAMLADIPNVDNYMTRAKVCYGVTIFTDGVASDGKPVYALKPPVAGEDPTYKTILDPKNKCDGAQVATIHTPKGDKQIKTAAIDHDWTTVRMFINYSTIVSGAGCAEGDQQSCIDAGMDPDPNAGAAAVDGAGTPTCNSLAPPRQLTGYHMTRCQDFSGGALSDGWSAYDDNGKANSTTKGVGRVAAQCVVANDLLTLTQLANGATCGVSSDASPGKDGQKYGYWEVRMLAKETGGAGTKTHPVLLLWPDAENWPQGGEYDYFETDMGNEAGGFLHCASNAGGNCVDISDIAPGKDSAFYSVFHDWGFEWRPDGFAGFIDGQPWWTSSNTGAQAPGTMHQTIQLDALDGAPPMAPAVMQVDWVHVFSK